MATIEEIAGTDLDADTLAVIQRAMTGKPLDPAVAIRLRAQGDKLRQQILEKHGTVDIAVPSIRELRGELPKS